jgi:hypothetical protein
MRWLLPSLAAIAALGGCKSEVVGQTEAPMLVPERMDGLLQPVGESQDGRTLARTARAGAIETPGALLVDQGPARFD